MLNEQKNIGGAHYMGGRRGPGNVFIGGAWAPQAPYGSTLLVICVSVSKRNATICNATKRIFTQVYIIYIIYSYIQNVINRKCIVSRRWDQGC